MIILRMVVQITKNSDLLNGILLMSLRRLFCDFVGL